MGRAGRQHIRCLVGVRGSVEAGSCFITLVLRWPLFFASSFPEPRLLPARAKSQGPAVPCSFSLSRG